MQNAGAVQPEMTSTQQQTLHNSTTLIVGPDSATTTRIFTHSDPIYILGTSTHLRVQGLTTAASKRTILHSAVQRSCGTRPRKEIKLIPAELKAVIEADGFLTGFLSPRLRLDNCMNVMLNSVSIFAAHVVVSELWYEKYCHV